MIEEDNNINENLIDNTNKNNKQEKLPTEKTALKSDSENKIEIKENIDNSINSNINNNNIDNNNDNLNSKAPLLNDIIIEDNIQKTDTLYFTNEKKKKVTVDNDENEIIYEGDEDLDSEKDNKNKNKLKSNFKYHVHINETFLKYATLLIIIIYIIITVISGLRFVDKREDFHPFLFCFEFLDRYPSQSQDMSDSVMIYFLTDVNSFCEIHFFVFVIFISVCYMLILGSQSQIKDFFKDMSIFLSLGLLLNIPIFFVGMYAEEFYGSYFKPIFYLILTFLGLLCMIKIFIVAKKHKYKNVSSLFNISILTSFLTAYQCYCFLFCVVYLIMNIIKQEIKVDSDHEFPEFEIIAGLIYFGIGIFVMTVFRDIFFVIAMVIIENGLLYTKRTNPKLLVTAIFNISIVSLNFASIIIIIFAYNKKVFRLKEKQ